MNARKSLILWIVAIIVFVGVVAGFAHGAQLTDAEPLKGAAWMVGSVGIMALEVFVFVRLNRVKD